MYTVCVSMCPQTPLCMWRSTIGDMQTHVHVVSINWSGFQFGLKRGSEVPICSRKGVGGFKFDE